MFNHELIVRNWRVSKGDPSGAHVWFDPGKELVRLFRLPPHDSEAATEDHAGVDKPGESGYLDSVISVSAEGNDARELSLGEQQWFDFFGEENDPQS